MFPKISSQQYVVGSNEGLCVGLRDALNKKTLAYTTHYVNDVEKIPTNSQIGCLVIAVEPTERTVLALESCSHAWFIVTVGSKKEYVGLSQFSASASICAENDTYIALLERQDKKEQNNYTESSSLPLSSNKVNITLINRLFNSSSGQTQEILLNN